MECRICLDGSGTLVSICDCKGTNEFVHEECMTRWFLVSGKLQCPTCKFNFQASTPPTEPQLIQHVAYIAAVLGRLLSVFDPA